MWRVPNGAHSNNRKPTVIPEPIKLGLFTQPRYLNLKPPKNPQGWASKKRFLQRWYSIQKNDLPQMGCHFHL